MSVLDQLAQLGIQVVSCADFAGDRPYERVEPWQPTALYFNAETDPASSGQRDPFVTAELIRDCARAGYRPCAYFVMPRGDTSAEGGARYAKTCSDRVSELGGAAIPFVMHDVEKVSLGFQRGFLDAWDSLRPWRPTIYNVEPFQDASQNDYLRMLRRNSQGIATGRGKIRKIAVQSYFGGMQPQRVRDVIEYLTARALDRDDLQPCIDPAQPASYLTSAIDAGCRGAIIFEAGRIPG
jgi:hypothetical protein